MKITARTKVCIIIGDPIEHSLSPQMHNAAYEHLGIEDEFVYVASRVKIENVRTVIQAMRDMEIRGLTCTIPHKVEVMKYLDQIDPIAEKIGAVNTVVNENGVIKGYNTDWLGVLIPLEKITTLKNKKAAVLGAGGAARAFVYALTSKGVHVTIFNRTLEKAETLAKEFNSQAKPADDYEEIGKSDIILNATSIGLAPSEKETPIPKEYLKDTHIVFDAVYKPYETRFIKDAQEKGAGIIHGLDMLLYQGVEQFRLFTDRDAPVEEMKKVLQQHLGL